jgi:hypothetical protein
MAHSRPRQVFTQSLEILSSVIWAYEPWSDLSGFPEYPSRAALPAF